jgi:hypothetical protein
LQHLFHYQYPPSNPRHSGNRGGHTHHDGHTSRGGHIHHGGPTHHAGPTHHGSRGGVRGGSRPVHTSSRHAAAAVTMYTTAPVRPFHPYRGGRGGYHGGNHVGRGSHTSRGSRGASHGVYRGSRGRPLNDHTSAPPTHSA